MFPSTEKVTLELCLGKRTGVHSADNGQDLSQQTHCMYTEEKAQGVLLVLLAV